ncbi:hypothetical protein SDC9_164896 [bioreactor metagenome]|uniref:Uncharacterized protein n=1 Tax=bioreactor metagenome TaxID=1076179 RepID=A0A645FV52_9ZZZZ
MHLVNSGHITVVVVLVFNPLRRSDPLEFPIQRPHSLGCGGHHIFVIKVQVILRQIKNIKTLKGPTGTIVGQRPHLGKGGEIKRTDDAKKLMVDRIRNCVDQPLRVTNRIDGILFRSLQEHGRGNAQFFFQLVQLREVLDKSLLTNFISRKLQDEGGIGQVNRTKEVPTIDRLLLGVLIFTPDKNVIQKIPTKRKLGQLNQDTILNGTISEQGFVSLANLIESSFL